MSNETVEGGSGMHLLLPPLLLLLQQCADLLWARVAVVLVHPSSVDRTCRPRQAAAIPPLRFVASFAIRYFLCRTEGGRPSSVVRAGASSKTPRQQVAITCWLLQLLVCPVGSDSSRTRNRWTSILRWLCH